MSEGMTAKVRTILRLEGRASILLARYESTLAGIKPDKHRAEQCKHRARALKVTLTAAELSALRRVRSGV